MTSNNSSSSFTDLVLNKLYYKFKVNDTISILLEDSLLLEKVFYKLRLIKREKVDDAIAFASIIIKLRYNAKYLVINFKKGDKVFLKLYYKYSISKLFNRKLL